MAGRGVAASLLLFVFAAVPACTGLIPSPSAPLGVEPAPWLLDEAAGNELALRALTGAADCDQIVDVDVEESEQRVEITIWLETQAGDCFLVRNYQPVSVTLDSPLGGRELLGCMVVERAPPADQLTCNAVVNN